jgi:hypothetical protein
MPLLTYGLAALPVGPAVARVCAACSARSGGIVLFVQIGALEVENFDQIKYEGTPHFPVTASSAKIGFSESI